MDQVIRKIKKPCCISNLYIMIKKKKLIFNAGHKRVLKKDMNVAQWLMVKSRVDLARLPYQIFVSCIKFDTPKFITIAISKISSKYWYGMIHC